MLVFVNRTTTGRPQTMTARRVGLKDSAWFSPPTRAWSSSVGVCGCLIGRIPSSSGHTNSSSHAFCCKMVRASRALWIMLGGGTYPCELLAEAPDTEAMWAASISAPSAGPRKRREPSRLRYTPARSTRSQQASSQCGPEGGSSSRTFFFPDVPCPAPQIFLRKEGMPGAGRVRACAFLEKALWFA